MLLYIMIMKPDTSETLSCFQKSRAQVFWIMATALTMTGGIILIALLKPALPIRIFAVALPLGCGGAFTVRLLRDFARLDELQARILLEASATACLGVFLALFVYPIFRFAGFVGELQPYYVSLLLAGLFLFGSFNAKRRYR
jgi:hypothetical protein